MDERDPGPVHLSWVLATSNPDQLAYFYAAVLECQARRGLSDSHWLVNAGQGAALQFYRPSRARDPEPQGRAWSPCLNRTTSGDPLVAVTAWSSQACDRGAQRKESPRLESFGAECWMRDPEGHAFLLLVTSDLSR